MNRITIDGKSGVVVYLDATTQHVVQPQRAAFALVRLDDGSSSFFVTDGGQRPTASDLRGCWRDAFDLAFDPAQPRDEDGRWVAEGGASPLSEDEGYAWHESGPGLDFAKRLTDDERIALDGYAGFGYKDVNGLLRGVPPTEKIKVRPATDEERARLHAEAYQDGSLRKTYAEIPVSDTERLVFDIHGGIGEWGHPHDPYYLERTQPDQKRIERIKTQANKINEAIQDKGVVLDKPMMVHRYAYYPDIDPRYLPTKEGETIVEKGFTSTSLGQISRLRFGPAAAKTDYLYEKYGKTDVSQFVKAGGAAVMFNITLPKGTKVASVEATRRSRVSDYTGKPEFRFESDRAYRTESEVLLGSGAHFKITGVKVNAMRSQYTALYDTPVTVVEMEYVGGGTSDGKRKHDYHLGWCLTCRVPRYDCVFDPDQPRDENGKWSSTGAFSKDVAERALRDVLPADGGHSMSQMTVVSVEDKPIAIKAAMQTRDVLSRMKQDGYELPKMVVVKTHDDLLRGQTEVFGSGYTALEVFVPSQLPPDADLDAAVMAVFGRDSKPMADGGKVVAYTERTFADVVVHEMGHVLHAANGAMVEMPAVSKAWGDNTPLFGVKYPVSVAMADVSEYAASSPVEFVAESFTKMFNGEKLSDDAMTLYRMLNGPSVKSGRKS